MNLELLWVVGLLATTVALFIHNRLRLDVIALLVIMAFSVSGTLTLNEALAGFSDPSVILIAALFVIGEGLVRTGVAYQVGDWLIARAGSSEARLLVLLMLAVAGLGSVMSSTGVVAIFIPVVLSIAAKLKIPPGRLMMPLAFAGLISGMMTLVATPPNMVVNSELAREGHAGFGFFAFTPIGLMVLAIGVAYMLLTRNWLNAASPAEVGAPKARRTLRDLIRDYRLAGRERRLQVQLGSPLIGSTLEELQLRTRLGANVVGLRRDHEALTDGMLEEKLRLGDTLLVIGAWKAIRQLQGRNRDFLVLSLPAEIDEVAPALSKAPHALLSLAVMVALMVSGVVPNVVAALVGCLLMGLFRCIDMDGAYRAIHWQSLVLIVGMLPFALALQKTGGIDLVVSLLVDALGDAGPRVLLASLFLLTAAIGLFISNTATAVLMAPIAIATAKQIGASPYPFAMVVAVAASAAFMTPISSPVNTLVLGPGQYRFGDFVRIGVPFTLLVMFVCVLVIPWLFPL
ncbi:TPA: TRAP transporter large permease subunit [Pseudomonas aeruginosa]|nr:TRAP transporter large permease subunit [Pseudomonas aeruginosa]